MSYQTKIGKLYVPCKRGDSIIAPGKPKQIRFFNGMCGGYIDPADWTIPPCLSNYNMGETLWIEVDKTTAAKTFAIDAGRSAVNGYSDDTSNPKYRHNKYFIDFQALQPFIEAQCPDFIKKVYEHKKKINVIKLDSLPAEAIKNSKDIDINKELIDDVGQITTGIYTVGPAGGDNYPTFGGAGGAHVAMGNLTGNLSLINTGPITEAAFASNAILLGGFTFTNTTNANPLGSPLGVNLIQINHNANFITFQQNGPGNIIVDGLCVRRTAAALNNATALIQTVNMAALPTVIIRNNLFDGNDPALAVVSRGVYIQNSTVAIFQIYNNSIWDGWIGIVFDAGQTNAANVIANNNIYNNASQGINFGDIVGVGTARNNAIFGNAGTDVRFPNAATARYNYFSDATGADGVWAVGVGNQINQVAAQGWQSVNDAQANFLDIITGGIFDGAGEANALARPTCIRGRRVPGPNGTSVGAAEVPPAVVLGGSRISIPVSISIG